MDPKLLHAVWSASDNTRLTPKQQSFRLPIHVAARIAALAELFPNRTKTQIVGDLLASALDQVPQGFEFVKGEFFMEEPNSGKSLYYDVGIHARYVALANRFHRELEFELGIKDPEDIMGPPVDFAPGE